MSNNDKFFSIRKNEAGAKTYNIKVRLNAVLDPQIGTTIEQLIGKNVTHGKRTEDGGGEFKGTIKATGNGRGGYIPIETLRQLLNYKGQLVLMSQAELHYSGAYIAKDVKYTNTTPKTKTKTGTYEVDVTFQRVKNQPVTFPSNNATKTPSTVKQNDTTGKKSVKKLSAEYEKFLNTCPTLGMDKIRSKKENKKYKNIKNDACVKTLQKLLQKNKRYLKCRVDGWFHTCTRDAVKAYKKDKKITPINGIVDKKTKKALLGI